MANQLAKAKERRGRGQENSRDPGFQKIKAHHGELNLAWRVKGVLEAPERRGRNLMVK